MNGMFEAKLFEPLPDDIIIQISSLKDIHMQGLELKALYDAVMSLPSEPVIVEIGSYYGGSSSVLAMAAKKKNGKIICIDPFLLGENTKQEFTDKVLSKFDNMTLLADKSDKVKDSVKESIDLLFIDGDHSKEAVLNDIYNYSGKVKKNGYIAFHDYYNVAYDGVRQAVDSAFTNKEKKQVWNMLIMQN